MDEALKAVEVCSEEGLQKFLPSEMWIYMCLEKSRLVLRGRDKVERVFEVSSGGHRGRDIYHSVHAWTLSSHYYYGGTLFTGSVMCFLSAWVLHIVIITLADRRHSSHAN